MEDIREGVAQVSKLIKAAREVAREANRDQRNARDSSRDANFEANLRDKLGFGRDLQVWLPPF